MAFVGSVGGVRAGRAAAATARCTSRKAAPAARLRMAKDGAPDFEIRWDDLFPADTEFAKMFAKERTKDVKPVANTVQAFFNSYARPIPTVYSSLVNETLTTTHLSVYHAMFTYDAMFAYGFKESFDRFFAFYPDEEQRKRLFTCMLQALELDEKKLVSDASAVKAWTEGKTVADLMAIADGSSEDTSCPGLVSAFKVAREKKPMFYHFSRMFSLGIVYLLEAVGGKTTQEEADKIAEKLGKTSYYIKDAMDQYRAGMERLKAAEQLYAEVNARDSKRLAERLAEKAKRAEEEALRAENEPEPVQPEV
ncbi:Protein THYLAKOID FORMATION 1, chloroplastic [Porphyridium purpureum]|uniref:Protein THYLAKOID FORMATION 1, chloroplastic n=1 Tax=Porphyridium purpureum TaxID=35688 RepID=A0A5J4Z783_PORPP|nr:Protein THYLAKOID FORMATION 1, chloroplastic [Porphyridium purpureum]|eukprot:POR4463..scf295_1